MARTVYGLNGPNLAPLGKLQRLARFPGATKP